MKRHLGLQQLSREHHHALALARRLKVAAARADATEDDSAREVSEARAAFATQILPHFAVEERELLPLCHGGGVDMVAHAERIRADHAALRALFGALAAGGFVRDAAAVGERLEAHVRFEERVWFPALEALLDDATLGELAWRLEPEPRVPVVGFRPDEAEGGGAWIAALACGHSQHVRHKPPFQNAEWVTSPEGRAAKVGVRLRCLLCRMPRLPPKADCYKETPVFDETSVPPGLLASHTLRAGTWGQIVVLEGRVDYVIEADPPLSFVLRAGVAGHIAPESPHHVRLQPGARFKVRFLR